MLWVQLPLGATLFLLKLIKTPWSKFRLKMLTRSYREKLNSNELWILNISCQADEGEEVKPRPQSRGASRRSELLDNAYIEAKERRRREGMTSEPQVRPKWVHNQIFDVFDINLFQEKAVMGIGLYRGILVCWWFVKFSYDNVEQSCSCN